MSPQVSENQNPEQIARDKIDGQLRACGWAVQNKEAYDPSEGEGQAVREYPTDTGPADYVLFVDKKPLGVIEAKQEALGHKITTVEDQTVDYAKAKLKWVQNSGEALPFLYEATGVITRFTDQRDPKPRSRELFTFHRPETLREWLGEGSSLRARLAADVPPLDPTALVALIRHVCGIDSELRPFSDTVRRNFQDWIMQRHAGKQAKFTEEQTRWLQQIRDSIIANHHFQRDDLEFDPFDRQGGLGKMYQLFGDDMDALIEELNGELTA